MSNRIENILGTIGNTPTVSIEKLAPDGIDLSENAGSISDRVPIGRS